MTGTDNTGLGASLTHKARQDTKSIKIWMWFLFSHVKFKQIPIYHFSRRKPNLAFEKAFAPWNTKLLK